jgi:hypothetical protein
MLPTKKFFAEVREVHSGDDLILLVDLGIDNLYKKTRARLCGVDTPDAYKADPSTEAGKVRDYVKNLVKNRRCYIEVHSERKNSWLITLFIEQGNMLTCLNKLLIDDGYVYQSRSSDTDVLANDEVVQQIAAEMRQIA